MAFETSETLGDFVVCSPSTLRIVPIFEGCLRLTIFPSGIPIVHPSVFSTSLDSLSVTSDSVLIVYLNIPSSLSIIIYGTILSCIDDLVCEVGIFFRSRPSVLLSSILTSLSAFQLHSYLWLTCLHNLRRFVHFHLQSSACNSEF